MLLNTPATLDFEHSLAHTLRGERMKDIIAAADSLSLVAAIVVGSAFVVGCRIAAETQEVVSQIRALRSD